MPFASYFFKKLKTMSDNFNLRVDRKKSSKRVNYLYWKDF